MYNLGTGCLEIHDQMQAYTVLEGFFRTLAKCKKLLLSHSYLLVLNRSRRVFVLIVPHARLHKTMRNETIILSFNAGKAKNTITKIA